MAEIISIPRELMKVSATNWRILYGSRQVGGDTAGGDQRIINPSLKWVGQPKVVMGIREMRAWQAMLDMGQGRVNLYRVPMVEILKSPFDRMEIPNTGVATLTSSNMTSRAAIEPRPTVRCDAPVSAGARSIIVDESTLISPIPVGWILSHNDWPFRVTWRAPAAGGMTELGTSVIRRAIPDNAAIDIFATGLFRSLSDEGAFPEPEGQLATVSMDFEEFITR